MDVNHPNVADCDTSNKKNKPKIVWDNATFMEFIDAYLTEHRKGNRPGTSFNKVGWGNIAKPLKEKTGKILDKKQLKNKWDNMKKEWKLYDRLMRLETGIGGTRSLINAAPKWWEEKINVDKDFSKFRGANFEIYETHYAPLFRDCVAVGDHTMTPLQFENNGNLNNVPRDENIEDKGDELNSGDDDHFFPSFVESSSSKRKKSKDVSKKRSTKSKTSSFEEKLDVVLDALSIKNTQSFSSNNPSPTISDCMNIVITFPGFNEGSRQYSQALRVFVKKQNREAFMFPTTDEGKMEFLKLVMEE